MSEDLIRRSDAIDAIREWGLIDGLSEGQAIEILEDEEKVPSAQRKGRWVIRDNPGTGWYRVVCSECGEDVTSTIPVIGYFPNAKPTWDYCPHCGAEMDGGDCDIPIEYFENGGI